MPVQVIKTSIFKDVRSIPMREMKLQMLALLVNDTDKPAVYVYRLPIYSEFYVLDLSDGTVFTEIVANDWRVVPLKKTDFIDVRFTTKPRS